MFLEEKTSERVGQARECSWEDLEIKISLEIDLNYILNNTISFKEKNRFLVCFFAG